MKWILEKIIEPLLPALTFIGKLVARIVSVLTPLAALIVGVVSVVAGLWLKQQSWAGAELLATLATTFGVGVLVVGFTPPVASLLWGGAKEVAAVVLKPVLSTVAGMLGAPASLVWGVGSRLQPWGAGFAISTGMPSVTF